jgi:hypothetical protein
VLIGCERSSHGPKTLKAAGFNFQSEDLGVLALKNAMRGAGIPVSPRDRPTDSLLASVIGTLMPSVASVYWYVLSNSSETGILTSPE